MKIGTKIGFVSAWLVLLVACDDGGSDTTSSTSSGSSMSTGAGGDGGAPSFEACAKQHPSGDVLICDEAFDTTPFVHLPEPTLGEDYMAMIGCDHFVDRDGAIHYRAASLPPLCDDPDTGGGNAEAAGHAFSLYRTRLDAKGAVTAFTRKLVIDEKNILRPLVNASADGSISAKKADGTFDLAPTLPIRVRFGEPSVLEAKDDGTTIYSLAGSVENFSAGALAANGTCSPPLSLAGEANPFGGATEVVIRFYRVPSMHGAGDDEGVVEYFVGGTSVGSAMDPAWFSPTSLLISTTPNPPLAEYSGIGHGTPGSIPTLNLKVVTQGGGPCTP
ncbi:MAG: hypothetical protein U0414_31615 [Polyangiaceae bacterium]